MTRIAYICKHSPIEVEVFVHGALCMCYSGQCYLSAMIGRRSGNRGQCAQPCRLNYGYDREENRYPLSLKDNCLVGYLRQLEEMGVACVKIEGRMKRAEYVAIATRIYKDAVLGRPVTQQSLRELEKVFSRQGFTDGYYAGQKGTHMFGTRQEEAPDRSLMARARATYENAENQRVPVWFRIQLYPGMASTLTVSDQEGHTLTVQGPMPEVARNVPLTAEALTQRLCKTGGTPYYVENVQVELTPGLTLAASAINGLRRDVLSSAVGSTRTAPPAAGGQLCAAAGLSGEQCVAGLYGADSVLRPGDSGSDCPASGDFICAAASAASLGFHGSGGLRGISCLRGAAQSDLEQRMVHGALPAFSGAAFGRE